MTNGTEKDDARAALKAALKGKTTTFRSEFMNGAGEHVTVINVVSKDILNEMLAKEVSKGRVVVLKEEDGTSTGYERVLHEDRYGKKMRVKIRYPYYGSEAQDREIVKKFPWEGK